MHLATCRSLSIPTDSADEAEILDLTRSEQTRERLTENGFGWQCGWQKKPDAHRRSPATPAALALGGARPKTRSERRAWWSSLPRAYSGFSPRLALGSAWPRRWQLTGDWVWAASIALGRCLTGDPLGIMHAASRIDDGWLTLRAARAHNGNLNRWCCTPLRWGPQPRRGSGPARHN